MSTPNVTTDYATVNNIKLYYEIHDSGAPLILLHGGFGLISMFGDVLPQLAKSRQVIAVELQAHGRTADIDRPLRFELLADDIAALIKHLRCASSLPRTADSSRREVGDEYSVHGAGTGRHYVRSDEGERQGLFIQRPRSRAPSVRSRR